MKKIWDYAPKEKRRELLKVLGYKREWAELTWDKIAKKGGGMLLNDLTRLNKKRLKNKRLKK